MVPNPRLDRQQPRRSTQPNQGPPEANGLVTDAQFAKLLDAVISMTSAHGEPGLSRMRKIADAVVAHALFRPAIGDAATLARAAQRR